MPIKIVENKQTILHKVFENSVVKGSGLTTTCVAIVQQNEHNKKLKRVLRVLLDSGSDGDLLFVHKGSKAIIPYKERYAPQRWRTSNGTFTTTNVGILELNFPEFAKSKVGTFKPDIVIINENEPPPAYDLVLGVKSLAKMGRNLTLPKRS